MNLGLVILVAIIGYGMFGILLSFFVLYVLGKIEVFEDWRRKRNEKKLCGSFSRR
jgi:hypothetical protein